MAAFAQAQDLLGRLGALSRRPGDARALTPHGQAMSELPAHPRIGHLLLRGNELGLGALACDVAALLGVLVAPKAFVRGSIVSLR